MKRKSITVVWVIATIAMMMFALSACVDDKDNDNDTQSENGATHQSSDDIALPSIPPDAVREQQGEGSQIFEVDQSNTDSGSFSHSFSIDENSGSSHSFSIEGGSDDGGGE